MMNNYALILTTLYASSLIASDSYMIHYDPFAKTQKILKHTSKKPIYPSKGLRLGAIFNNQAFINGRFYSAGQKVGNYTIVKITSKSVTLKKGSRYIFLKPAEPKKDKYFIIKDKI